MKLLLIIIICILINVLSKYIFKVIEEIRNMKKVKNNVNNIDFQEILKGLDKDFYNDLKNDDIDLEK